MKTLPTVSVIVPIYGVEKYIERCARSIFEQIYKSFEVIFVDDCSKDNSIAILTNVIKEYPSIQCEIIRHERNRGLSATRNTGVEAASGKYILHVDSDDWIEPEMISRLVEEADKSNADIVVCGYYAVYPQKIRPSIPKVYDDKTTMIKDILFKYTSGSMWGKLISKDIYDQHEDAWSIEGINHGEDYATMPRLLYYSSKVVCINKCLYNYNLQNHTSYTKNFSEASMYSMLRADKVLEDFFKDKYDELDIVLMQLRTKTGMIKRGNAELFTKISKLYYTIPLRYYFRLNFIDMCLLLGIKCGCGKLLGCLINKQLNSL